MSADNEHQRKVDAAFLQAAREVVKRAKQTGTPVIVWQDGQIKELPPEHFAHLLNEAEGTKEQSRRRSAYLRHELLSNLDQEPSMSADSCLVFYGLRFEIADHEIEALETRTDPRLRAARDIGLKHHWSYFPSPVDRYLLFIGLPVGDMGPEGELEVQFDDEQYRTLTASVREKLAQTGLEGVPQLYLQWRADF